MAAKKRAPRKTKPVETTEVTFEQPVAPVEEKKLPPWKDLAPKQKELMALCREKTGAKKLIGVFGTRLAGKSVAAFNAIVDHMWRTKDAEVLMLVKTQGEGTTGGSWSQLTERIMPRWFEHSLSPPGTPEKDQVFMSWAPRGEPRATVAKKMIASITNMHGGVSKIMLDSLDDESEIDKYKGRSFTMIYWNECGEFKEKNSFMTLVMALRGVGYAQDDFVLLADANPPDEGEAHFLYYYFFELKNKPDATPEEIAFKKQIHRTDWSMLDNCYLDEDTKNATKGLYMSDPDLFDRFCRGMWKRAMRDAIFADIFKLGVHVVGNLRDDQNELIPEPDCTELFTSHDAGYKNPSTHVIEQVPELVIHEDRDGKRTTRRIVRFKILDELAYINTEVQVKRFTRETLDMKDRWEQVLGHAVPWTDFSDLSALISTESISARTVADEMYAESNGRISLIGVEKGDKSVEMRVRLTRKLLLEDRLLISGRRCPKLVEAMQCLSWQKIRGVVQVGKIQKGSEFKHAWDSMSYGIVKLCWSELQAFTTMVRTAGRQEGTLVSLPM